jgi:serine/threonine protein kinase
MANLLTGARLGPYEILAPLGAGGLGEVYRAHDNRLDRTVAIKVLPPAFAADPQFRERFDREAKTISQLDHPNICAVYDVGRLRVSDASASQGDEIDFIVMQYLEGETLDARLKSRAPSGLPIHQTLTIAIDVASALDKAHRAGIVHRDLKPGNVMLTKTGAKLLDFGPAKTGVPAVSSSTAGSVLPTTIGSPLTRRRTNHRSGLRTENGSRSARRAEERAAFIESVRTTPASRRFSSSQNRRCHP